MIMSILGFLSLLSFLQEYSNNKSEKVQILDLFKKKGEGGSSLFL